LEVLKILQYAPVIPGLPVNGIRWSYMLQKRGHL